ncbi:MAG TPA: outer membrane protein assembly factor BamD [Bacteroidales bacterium]|jgi:outer membrane protein assembly factor BamD|nr:outer membrane protein assembly factor BamD [Bacteroidales bacterium]HNY75336.1 outer membrane protein assembly factor BamD [Bacteroidales bacterium]HRC78679.1 outer membrane protein assembly factor BamD [Bacteroidales bacterium]
MKAKILCAFTLLLIVFSSCRDNIEFNKIAKADDPELKYAKVLEYYQEGRYYQVIQLCEMIIPYYRGTTKSQELYYYMAWSYYHQGDYILASYHFSEFAKTFPSSKYAEECAFQAAYSKYKLAPTYYLDQSTTKEAIKDFQLFISRYPNSSKILEAKDCIDKLSANLEKKDYANSKLYYDIQEYKASIVSLNNFIKDYPASNYKEDANYYLCLSHYYYAINSVKNKQLTRFQQAMDAINNFMSLYPNSQYINKLNDIKAEIQKQINLKQNI